MDLRFILYILYLALVSKSYRNWTVLNAGEVVAGVAIARIDVHGYEKLKHLIPSKTICF